MKTTIRILSALIAGLVGMFVGECALAYTLLRVVPPNLTDVQIEVQREFTILRYAQAWSWRGSRLSWKWRKRSSVKITERTYEKRAQALQRRRESGHSEAASFGQGCSLRSV